MNPVWKNELYIGVSKTEGATPEWTYAKLCKGIESMSFTENEQNQQGFYICGKGFAHNEVTGAAPEIAVTGKRIVGDPAQDYIAGLQFKLGSDRNSSVKIVAEGQTMIFDCTIGNITSFGGNTLDLNNFGCTIRCNGEPTVTPTT